MGRVKRQGEIGIRSYPNGGARTEGDVLLLDLETSNEYISR